MSEQAAISGFDATQESSARSTLIFPTNARLEHSRTTRRKLQVINRALEANFTFISRLKAKFGRCVAGTGIFPVPVTSDTDWNMRAKELFERWYSNPDTYSIDASVDGWEDQRFIAEELGAGDGETFEARVKVGGLLMIQPLDPFEIETPYGTSLDPRLYDDGIRFNGFLRPVAYSVRELAGPNEPYSGKNWREISSRDMIHVFRRRRRKQARGIPPTYSGQNDGTDALDTLALEKATTKLHALLGVAKIVKPDNKGKGMSDQLARVLNADGSVDRLEDMYKRGAATVELNEGEDLKLLTSTRPSNPVIEGVKLYCQLVALGVDLPFSVVWSFAGLGGAPTRAELEDAQGTFGVQQDRVVWRSEQPKYVWYLADAMERGILRRCKDPYWWKCDWHGPAKITVDYGRSADANIKLTRNGLLSHPRYFEERGQDAKDEMRKQIDFMKWLRAECKKEGVPIETIIEPTPGAVQAEQQGNGKPPREDEEDEES
jgi:capsid protein